MSRIFDSLHATSPYEGADLGDVAVDMQGWGSTHFFFREIFDYLRPRLVVEVGTWKGMSAMHMADLAKERGIEDFEIACIDTWLGSPGVWRNKAKVAEVLHLKNGWPMLYFTFLKNVIERGHQDVITPMPMPSDMGYHVLKNLGVKADLIYVDAGHEYESCIRDLRLYKDLLSDDGILLGDDYETWEGVTRAAHEFAEEEGLTLVATRSKYVLSRNPDHVAKMQAVLTEVDARRARVAVARAAAAERAEEAEGADAPE